MRNRFATIENFLKKCIIMITWKLHTQFVQHTTHLFCFFPRNNIKEKPHCIYDFNESTLQRSALYYNNNNYRLKGQLASHQLSLSYIMIMMMGIVMISKAIKIKMKGEQEGAISSSLWALFYGSGIFFFCVSLYVIRNIQD